MNSILAIFLAGALTLASGTDNIDKTVRKAERGDAKAQLEYARLLKTADEWDKAVKMLQLSADKGNSDAQWELGLLYEHANHVAQDNGKAFDLYRRSAESGNPMGLYLEAHCYQHGIAVAEDLTISDSLYGKAFSELTRLAPKEDMYVLNFLGSAYQWGDGTRVDKKKAFEYYLISARKGNPETQCKVASCYETGQGTERNMTEALRWYGISASQGFADAISALERLTKRMESTRQITKTEKTDMDKIRTALIEACSAMEKKAREMDMFGVAVATVLPKETKNDWIAEIKVVDKTYKIDEGPDGKGWNLMAIAWSKAGEVIVSEADSGNPERKTMVGELNYVGGAYDETEDYKFAFAFSGGTSEDDLLVAQYGIETLKALLR